MKVIVIAALLALASANDWTLFNDFVVKYEKKYDSFEDMGRRFEIFRTSLVRIARLNAEHIARGGDAIFGVTSLADLTVEEFQATRLMKNMTYRAPAPQSDIPSLPQTDVDWRTKGVVTAVKDQGNCGSCWAHSADEATESFNAIKHTTLLTLSVQQCTACTYTYNGCNGGWPHDAYVNAIQKRNGIDLDSAYPYNIAQAGNCKFGATGPCDAPAAKDQASGTPFVSPAQGQLQNLLTNTGPVSVCVAAEQWQDYTGGIMKSCPGSVDHCVQAVGYTQSGSEPYWVVRNSWGTGWGVKGYIYLDMAANNGDICHIQEYMTYPLMQ
jgi:Pyruvate/2-oxoacid:ferredoxin oxidoreductase delta subunit